jgi:glycosyltransferase involved in cell wall biosynthesis
MNESVKKQLRELKPEAKVINLPHPSYSHFGNGMDKNTARKKLNINPDKKTLLFFGLIRDYKGLDLLLDAFNQLKDDYQLIVAGEVYGDFKKYQEIIDKGGKSADIYLHQEYIPDQEVKQYFSAADLCVLPYKSATQSGICAIAKSFKVPVLVTDVGGLKAYVLNEKAGIIAEEISSSSIQKNIEDFFNSSLQNNFYLGNEKVENEEWDEFANQLLKFADSF